MSHAAPTPADHHDAPHGSAAGGDPHGTGHDAASGHDAAPGHDAPALGPVDMAAWGAGLLGVALALVMVVCFILATQPS